MNDQRGDQTFFNADRFLTLVGGGGAVRVSRFLGSTAILIHLSLIINLCSFKFMTLCSLSTVFLCEDGGCVVKEVCLKHYAMRNEAAIWFLIIKMNVRSVFCMPQLVTSPNLY